MSIGIFLTYLVPSTLLFIPFSRLVASLGLQNQLWALVLIYPTFTVPFCTWLLMGFLKTLPKEVEESAMVDGCSRLGAIGRVVLPLAVPGLLTVVIFALTLTIQEFVYSLTFISSVGRMTVSVGVPVALVRGDVYYWGSLMAACLITSVPLAVLYNFFLDRFIAGFTVGAIK
jgi:multiple sugar transport system permease protein